MDGDLGTIMQSVLSDPEQMAKIGQLAQSLMGGSGGEESSSPQEPEGTAAPTPAAVPSPPAGDGRILSVLTKALTDRGTTRSTALLTAMRPYMRPEKQEKLDRAMQIAKMARIAGSVMGELGGRRNGL